MSEKGKRYAFVKTGKPLQDWLYLIHHIHIGVKTTAEVLHHCPLVDHLGNLYRVEHIKDEHGKVQHCVVGLVDDQEVFYADEDAQADGNKVPCANRQLAG